MQRYRKSLCRQWRLGPVCIAILFLVGGKGQAQDKNSEPPLDDLTRRVERLERQNQELRSQLSRQSADGQASTPPSDGREGAGERAAPGSGETRPGPTDGSQGSSAPVGSDGREGPGGRAAPGSGETRPGPTGERPLTDRWIEVGNDLGMRAGWINYQPWLESNDKAFRVHVGGRLMYDSAWGQASNRVENGIGGIGPFTDAVFPRRARLQADGWIYEIFDFMCDYEFLGQEINVDPTTRATPDNIINTPTPAQLYAGVNFLPIIGTVRVGNQRAPIGLDRMMSTNFLDFMERSLGFDAFLNSTGNFMPGIEMMNWTDNERMTWQVGLFKDNKRLFGWDVGGGNYAAVGRVTWLPWYEYNGRYMIHLGFGSQVNALENGSVTLKSRPLIRNAPPGLLATTSFVTINNGNTQSIVNPEFFMNIGSLSIQAEYQACWVQDVTSVNTPTGTKTVPRQTFFGQSYYVQAVYFLTGERRPYNRIPLHTAGASPTQVVPIRNFFWLPGHHCPNPFSSGAWQIGVRYNYLDLNSGSINGGRIHEVTTGLVWHLNPNMRIYLDYDIGYRSIPGGTSSGTFQVLGSRLGVNF